MLERIYVLLVGVAGIGCLALIDYQYRAQLRLEEAQHLSETATAVERELTRTIQGLNESVFNLQAFMLSARTLPNAEAFDNFATNVLAHHPELHALVYVGPDRVIQRIAPLAPNRAAIGVDLRKRPSAAHVEWAITARRMVVDNPHLIVGGKLAVVARAPLFRGDEFLGLAQGVYDIEVIVRQSLASTVDAYAVSLRDQSGALFWGPPSLPGMIERRVVSVADTTWELTLGGEPRPLHTTAKLALLMLHGIGGVLVLMLMLQVHRAVTHTRRLNQQVATKTHELAESEYRLRVLMDNASDGIIVTDWRGRIVDANRRAVAMLGAEKSDVIGSSARSLLAPDDDHIYPGAVRDLFAFGSCLCECRLITKDNTELRTEIAGTRIEVGSTSLYLANLRDITERKRLESELRRRNTELEAIFGSVHVCMAVLDRNLNLIRVNAALAGAAETSPRMLIGRNATELLDNRGEVAAKLEEVMASGQSRGAIAGEWHGANRSTISYWDWMLTPLKDGNDNVEGVLLTAIDATERERARREAEAGYQRMQVELELRVRERTAALETANRELESFSYSVSHDLRAPLRAINGFSAALQEEYAQVLGDTGRGYLSRIQNATVRMSDLIDGVLQLSRVVRTELQWSSIDLSAMVDELVRQHQYTDPDHLVVVQIQRGLVAAGDVTLMRLVLQNLLNNAWKFTARASAPAVTFGAEWRSGRRVFFLRDNGIGFDMAYANKLFRPFERLHRHDEFDGTGIGLATVRRVIERHGGEVWAEGVLNEGATIYFTLGQRLTATGSDDNGEDAMAASSGGAS